MAWTNSTSLGCVDNCSGHGECHNGTCLCEVCPSGFCLKKKSNFCSTQIRFEGEVCRTPNFSYHAAFASVFFLLALVCLIQLVMCIAAEFQKMKTPSLWRACRVTTQKLLYLLVFLATTIRGAYFTSPVVCVYLKTS
jgi:von Hippel-Lindau disease tumor supressor